MTYEDYKSSKSNKKKKKNYLVILLNKLFTCIIFTMIIIILCNTIPSFKSFIIDDILNRTMDFSVINNFINKTTDIFNESDSKTVSSVVNDECSSYLDGIKCKMINNENVYVKSGGIVTFIGKKDGYNNTVIIQQSNGYYAWYGNINESIKLYDYVESGSILGTSSDEYYYVLFKDDKAVDLTSEN